ncbi:MAG TPA: sulfatase-like hydrolase/transferase, partial [Thermoplasmata archaeon]|nr:sulfatase-like hydrolase/transferase [Thermoplasmata archaeon]
AHRGDGGERVTGAPDGRRPDLLVVVLDCVRASDFAGGREAVSPMPFAESLLRESVHFPRAASVAPWTIPSHASLFTGRYPWENGVHMLKELRLEPSVPTLAGYLGRAGYASFSASANGFICPDLGLTNGFESSTWGDWWERYLRLPTRELPPRAENFGPTQRLPSGPQWNALEETAWNFHRFPVLIETLNRLVQQVRYRDDPNRLAVSPWIERTVRRWIGGRPKDQPTFTFVNFLDAHEPYLTDPMVVHHLGEWRRLTSVRMDRTSILAGNWTPTPREFQVLHDLYRAMVHFLDRRIAELVQVYKDAGRWENTAMVLTADHGQAFGEHGHLFHGQRLWEPLLRIPLIYRPPGGLPSGRVAKGWASLVDIAPTFMGLAGEDATGLFPSAYPLTDAVDGPRRQPVLAMADGIHQKTMVLTIAKKDRIADWDRRFIAVYDGDQKLVYDTTLEQFRAFDLLADPGEATDIYPARTAAFEEMKHAALDATRKMTSSVSSESAEVTGRLKSWGYL